MSLPLAAASGVARVLGTQGQSNKMCLSRFFQGGRIGPKSKMLYNGVVNA